MSTQRRQVGAPRIAWAGIAVVMLAGCGATTPAGPLGPRIALRSQLPASVVDKVPDDDHAERHQARIDVGQPPASVELTWRTARVGASSYLLSVEAAVAVPADGVELGVPTLGNPINMGTLDAVDEMVPLQLGWSHKGLGSTSSGAVSVEIRATGTLQKI